MSSVRLPLMTSGANLQNVKSVGRMGGFRFWESVSGVTVASGQQEPIPNILIYKVMGIVSLFGSLLEL